MTECKYMIFDLDGTLFDTIGDIMNSGNELLHTYGKAPYGLEDYKGFVGLGVERLVMALVSGRGIEATDLAKIIKQYLDIYRRRMLETTSLYPGIAELINDLKVRGITLGILSNKPDNDVLLLVEHFNLGSSFAVVMGKRPELPIKPDPASLLHVLKVLGAKLEEVVYVGDTKTDIETAKNAGVTSIGVTWGFRSRQELSDAGADFIVDEPGSILKIVKG